MAHSMADNIQVGLPRSTVLGVLGRTSNLLVLPLRISIHPSAIIGLSHAPSTSSICIPHFHMHTPAHASSHGKAGIQERQVRTGRAGSRKACWPAGRRRASPPHHRRRCPRQRRRLEIRRRQAAHVPGKRIDATPTVTAQACCWHCIYTSAASGVCTPGHRQAGRSRFIVAGPQGNVLTGPVLWSNS